MFFQDHEHLYPKVIQYMNTRIPGLDSEQKVCRDIVQKNPFFTLPAIKSLSEHLFLFAY